MEGLGRFSTSLIQIRSESVANKERNKDLESVSAITSTYGIYRGKTDLAAC